MMVSHARGPAHRTRRARVAASGTRL